MRSSLTLSLLLLISIVAALPGRSGEVRLSDVAVLLPYSDRVQHVIEAHNGCFDWSALPSSTFSCFSIPLSSEMLIAFLARPSQLPCLLNCRKSSNPSLVTLNVQNECGTKVSIRANADTASKGRQSTW